MLRTSLFAVALLSVTAFAQQPKEPQKGTIKKVDVDKGIIVITSGGKDIEATVTDDTKLQTAAGKTLEGKIKDKALKEGAECLFLARSKDGQTVLVGLRVRVPGEQTQPKIEKVDTTGLKPLTELGKGKYKDHQGGLYPDGKNERPEAHEKAGLALAKKVQPLDADGKPSADGKIVLLSVGMSNTTQEFSTFKQLADKDKEKNPKLVLVDGAQGGMTAAVIKSADEGRGKDFWTVVDKRLKDADVTRQQVQVAWLKEADAGPNQGFPKYAEKLRDEMRQIVQLLHVRFPNLKMVYLSSRIYAGYATTPLNPEPYAYESGFSVKWLIEEQIKGDKELNFDADKGAVQAPWLSWGPYLWANGTTKRADGLTYAESDFGNDGTHPSSAGRSKVAQQLLTFFKTDSTCKSWFVAK